jgi:hypothetical protein
MPSCLFDAYIAVDWSARSGRSRVRPSPNAIWVGERVVGGTATESLVPHKAGVPCASREAHR